MLLFDAFGHGQPTQKEWSISRALSQDWTGGPKVSVAKTWNLLTVAESIHKSVVPRLLGACSPSNISKDTLIMSFRTPSDCTCVIAWRSLGMLNFSSGYILGIDDDLEWEHRHRSSDGKSHYFRSSIVLWSQWSRVSTIKSLFRTLLIS